jgi:hypothetical protein
MCPAHDDPSLLCSQSPANLVKQPAVLCTGFYAELTADLLFPTAQLLSGCRLGVVRAATLVAGIAAVVTPPFYGTCCTPVKLQDFSQGARVSPTTISSAAALLLYAVCV